MVRDLIKKHEGLRLHVYTDTTGNATIGYGHKLSDRIPIVDITQEQAEDWLTEDIATAIAGCKKLYPTFDSFTQNRKDALIDFVFNVGFGTALKFIQMRGAILIGDWNKVAENMIDSLWYKQTPNRHDLIPMIREG